MSDIRDRLRAEEKENERLAEAFNDMERDKAALEAELKQALEESSDWEHEHNKEASKNLHYIKTIGNLKATIEAVRPIILTLAEQLTSEELDKKGIERNFQKSYDSTVSVARIAKNELDKVLEAK